MAPTTRRLFITKTALGIAGVGLSFRAGANSPTDETISPVVISTWNTGMQTNDAAWDILSAGGYSLDAVETGIRVAEADPEFLSNGFGRVPDSRGIVTYDASIMNEKGDAGSVAFLQCIRHPVSVARQVMEKTPHVMLAGKGAQRFALANGFKKEKLLTKEMRKQWKKQKFDLNEKNNTDVRLQGSNYAISMLAIDVRGRICGASTASGMPYKLHGRVGDSSIPGAGLYVDGETGGAAATGSGELVIKTLGSFLVVEFMRNGMSPSEACNAAIARIVKKIPDYEQHQIGYIAINKSGETGAASLHRGFNYAVKSNSSSQLREAGSWFKKL